MPVGKSWLDVRNQKLHGIKDSRWTVSDRLEQTRRAVDLQKRDQLVLRYQQARTRRREERQLGELRAQAKKKHDELRQALSCNTEQIYTQLCDHREIQRALGRKQPEVLMEHMTQANFNKRKLRDRLRYKKEKMMGKYKDDILTKSKYDDLLLMRQRGIKTLPDKHLQTMCNGLNNYKMKTIAAIAVRSSYRKMLAIIDKDSIFYDSVLDCLERDGKDQSNMLLVITEMGQLVMENVDDLKLEFFVLEKDIRVNLRERNNNLKSFRAMLDDFNAKMDTLTRSDINIRRNTVVSGESEVLTEIKTADALLALIRQFSKTNSNGDIFPRLFLQQQMGARLIGLRDVVENLRGQAQIANDNMILIAMIEKHTYNEEQIEFLKKQRDLLTAIRHRQRECDSRQKYIEDAAKVFSQIGESVKNLTSVLEPVSLDDEELRYQDFDIQEAIGFIGDPMSQFRDMQNRTERVNTLVSEGGIESITEEPSTLELLELAEKKCRRLFEVYHEEPDVKRPAEVFYERAMQNVIYDEDEREEIDLLEGVVLHDRNVPTHSFIKLASEEYVKENTVNELDVVAAAVAARRRPGLKFLKAEWQRIHKGLPKKCEWHDVKRH